MTPLGASLAFIIVSIIISTIKHFIFPSNSPSTSQQSSIELKKLYTITDKKTQKQNKSYGSFYQAYHQFHISQIQQRKHLIQQNFMLEYNSLVMKKSIINDQSIIVCDQNYLISLQQGINCNNQQNSPISNTCDWETTFNVYQLPLLKEQTKQIIKIKGQIKNTQKNQKSGQKKNKLQCKKYSQNKYFISFPLSTKNTINQEYIWSLNKIYIQTKEKVQILQSEKNSSKKGKKPEVKSYDIPKISGKIPKQNNTSFQLTHQSIDLQKPFHEPLIYSLSSQGVSYTTEAQPWLVRYKINKNQNWKNINIMQKQTQQKVFQGFTLSARTPPFQRMQKINIKYLFMFQTSQNIYEQKCEKGQCQEIVSQIRKNFVTVVYEHINNPYRVEKFFVQLTFELGNIGKESQSILKSYSFLISQINPARVIHSDCSMKLKKKSIYQRYYDTYYWLYEDKVIANVDIYSLLCVFRFDIDQHLRVIQIPDIIRSVQTNHYYDLIFVDWKSLKKMINYKQNFQIYLHNKQKSLQNKNLTTINKTQFPIQNSQYVPQTQHFQSTQQSINQMDLYLQIIKQQFQTHLDHQILSNHTQHQNKNQIKNKKEKTQTKKKSSNKNKSTNKKSKSNKKSQKKNKTTNKNIRKYLKTHFTPVQGLHKPSIQTSYNYSFYRKTYNDAIRTELRKYKFPLPFLLSFTENMEIVNGQPSKPLILFSGVKQYLFTYQLKQLQADTNTSLRKVVDYRYLTLGSTQQHTSKLFSPTEGTPQHQIQTSKSVIDQITQKVNTDPNQQPNIQIKDETHPQIQNVIKTIQQFDQKILNQIKSIKSVPVIYKKIKSPQNQSNQLIETYQRYLIVVWGWGIEVYLVDWDKNGFFKQNITQQQIQMKLSQKSNSLIEYFLPFIELFATFYCMFQALISSR